MRNETHGRLSIVSVKGTGKPIASAMAKVAAIATRSRSEMRSRGT